VPEPVPEPEPAVEVREDGLVPGAIPVAVRSADDDDGSWASDYATSDAPVRNAHYRGVYESTTEARQVRVFYEEESLDVVFSCEPGEFILDAADRAGFELPFSCRSGGCLSCSAQLLSGKVEMGEQYVLEDEHTSAGFFLLCCSTAQTDLVLRSHQEDNIT
jgi:2Fe-2S type ferredoxin